MKPAPQSLCLLPGVPVGTHLKARCSGFLVFSEGLPQRKQKRALGGVGGRGVRGVDLRAGAKRGLVAL